VVELPVGAAARARRRVKVPAALRFWLPVAVIAVLNLVTQWFYVERSRAEQPGVFTELPYGSSGHVLSVLSGGKPAFGDEVFTEAFNRGGGRMQNYFVNPAAIIYLGKDVYARESVARGGGRGELQNYLLPAPKPLIAHAYDMLADRTRFFTPVRFAFEPGTNSPVVGSARMDVRAQAVARQHGVHVIESLRESVLNRSSNGSGDDVYRVSTASQAVNRLVFVPTDLGQETYFGGRVGLFRLERDIYYPGGVFEALGRYLVFHIAAPSAHPRIAISMTNTLKTDGRNALPPMVVVGGRRLRFPIVGRGAARVFSPVFSPQTLAGMDFVGVDVGVDETPVRETKRTNLMLLFGRSVRADERNMTLFARDISVIDDADYRRLAAPSHVERFPADLADPNLEFSGIYEDGWTSESSRFVLQSNHSSTVVVRGTVPTVSDPAFRTRLCITVDGAQAGCTALDVGHFTFAARVDGIKDGKHEVRVHFDRYQNLGAGDGRPVAMLAEYIGFGNAQTD
jgi:hypothetical protein